MDSAASSSDDDSRVEATSSPPAASSAEATRPGHRIQEVVFDRWLRLQRAAAPRAAVLYPSVQRPPQATWLKLDAFHKPPSVGLMAAVAQAGGGAVAGHGAVSSLAAARLRHAKLIKTDDQVLWEALRKLKTIILAEPSATKLGRSLMSSVERRAPEVEWEQSFSDAFHGKSVATLTKRAAALWRFSKWMDANQLGLAITAGESCIYRYAQYLKRTAAPTSATSFIQAWTFLYYQAGIICHSIEAALSSRARGAARAALSTKAPLRQSAPLTARMIVALENVALRAPHEHWRIIAGHFLLCLGSCSRFSDSIRLHSLVLSESGGLVLVEAESKSYKTAPKEERRKRLLPLICLGRFFSRQAWAQSWMELRDRRGLGLDPALPAFSEVTGKWLDRRMTTGEAYLFLREFLTSSGFDAADLERVGCHSLKCTLLSYTVGPPRETTWTCRIASSSVTT